MRERFAGYSSPEQRVQAVVEDLPKNVIANGQKHGIPDETIRKAVANPDLPASPHGLRMICENLYHYDRAMGKKGRVRESDGPDMALTTYMSGIAWRLVTDDERLTGLLQEVLADARRVVDFGQFTEIVATQRPQR